MLSTRLVTVGEAVLESVIDKAGETVVLLPTGSHHIKYLAPLAQQLGAAGFRTVAGIQPLDHEEGTAPPATAGRSEANSAAGSASWTFARRGTFSSLSSPTRWPRP